MLARNFHHLFVVWVALAVVGCGENTPADNNPPGDSGPSDTGPSDTGKTDIGTDIGITDTGMADGGSDTGNNQPCEFGNNASCDDGNSCTDDECLSDGSCQHTARMNVCKIDDVCYAAGEAVPGNLCEICDPAASLTSWSAPDCDDGNECTSDACDSQLGCHNDPVQNGSACDDGIECTMDEVCTDGTCTGTCPCMVDSDCEGDAGACMRWACNNFNCEAVADVTLDGQACDDGQYCTTGEICGNGACAGGSLTDCSGLDGTCTVGQCDETTDMCTAVAALDGSPCDDAANCTENDVCMSGLCGGIPKDCSGLETQCISASCQESDGQCVTTINAGQACSDADVCTLSDTCDATGLCVGTWDEVNCGCNSDAACSGLTDACNAGRCDIASHTCYPDPNPGVLCDDGDACSVSDQCQVDGSCSGAAYVCNPPLSCMTSTCDGTGGCDTTINPGFCVIDNACYPHGTANPANPCELCDVTRNNTDWSDITDGTSCNADGDGCTQDDACFNGVCTAGPAASCMDDGLACTDNLCISTGSTTYTCSTVANGNGCYIGGQCYSGTNPSNDCEECVPLVTATGWSDKSVGAACGSSTDTACTNPDTCDGSGTCQPNHEPEGTVCPAGLCAAGNCECAFCCATTNLACATAAFCSNTACVTSGDVACAMADCQP